MTLDSPYLKLAIPLYSIPSICPNTVFSTHSSRKIRHAIHLKLQSALAVGRELSSLTLYSCSSIPLFPPRSGFPIKLASSRGPNLVKSFHVPTTLAKGPT
ncbi:hypothetical protein AVEN_70232-1 [Araneus ventricosus]|uniref:Uncharacterized protein n=1 Tax=Araneus ventricosus TaxID=182803 RepID=A0A4Y2GAF3_ARAVE|nr:hypothetical protein AVEN_70232-1 [Araneus ventricosus]